MNEKVLIVEDEAVIADSVAYALQKEGFRVMTAADGVQGLATARSESPDLMILDLMLPEMDGFDVCRTVRGESSVPIIMLTAKGEEVDGILGLELGADDYLIKPFSMRELVARVKAALRRPYIASAGDEGNVMQVADIVLDCRRRTVGVGDKVLTLPFKEFELLRVLMKNKDRVLSREMLLNVVWAGEVFDNTGTLDVHIRWLREKIEDDPSSPKRIITVRGVGYMFVGCDHDEER